MTKQKPNETWVTSFIPGIVTPEQTTLWQAGIQWFNATGPAQDDIVVQLPPAEPDVISGEEFRAELCNIADQQNDGRAKGSRAPTHSDLPPIDVRKFVANM